MVIVSCFSRILDQTQKKYAITNKEIMAAVKAIEYYLKYLIGKIFTLYTDHQTIEYIKTCKNLTSRMLRCALKLQGYDFDLKYIQENKNAADEFSRYTINSSFKNISYCKNKMAIRIIES